ncbi:MAG: hypothetical protein ACWA5W_02175 [Phycisphaerales bacterium]
MNTGQHNTIVHLVAAPSAMPQAPAYGRVIPVMLCALAIKHQLTPPGRVILIGDQSSQSQAHTLGLKPDTRIAPIMGKVSLARRTIKHAIGHPHRVICWNDELAPLLKGIPAELDLISTLPSSAPETISKRINIRTFESSDTDTWTQRGHHPQRDTVLAKVLDSVDDHLTLDDRQSIRSALGIDDSIMCLGVIADNPQQIDARELAFLLGLLDASGYALTGIVPNTASHLAAARRHHRGLGSPFSLRIATHPITSFLPAFDALIHPCFNATGSSMLLERMCENADIPVLRLKESTNEGLSRAPGVAGPIIEQLDEMIKAHQPNPEPAHV